MQMVVFILHYLELTVQQQDQQAQMVLHGQLKHCQVQAVVHFGIEVQTVI
jgi:hypothetical protein